MSRLTGISERNVQTRRNRLQGNGIVLPLISYNAGYQEYTEGDWTYPPSVPFAVRNASVVVGGDLHVWPGEIPGVWNAFCAVIEIVKPAAVVLNGDLIDGTKISRHGILRSQKAPRVTEEVDALTGQWLPLLPKQDFRKLVTIGNHDQRVDHYLANMAPELADWSGRLSDRLNGWDFGYSIMVNDNTEIRHKLRSGIHAGRNNTVKTGLSILNNHTHMLGVTPVIDRRGRRYGVQCGMLNKPNAPQFEYTQGEAHEWQPGFVVLTYDADGALLEPEICLWRDGRAWFRNVTLDVPGSKPRYRVKADGA